MLRVGTNPLTLIEAAARISSSGTAEDFCLSYAQTGCLQKPQEVTQRNKHWCAVYTKPQREEFAEVNLRLRRIDTFFPKLFLPKSAKRQETNRCAISKLPLCLH